MSTVLVCPLDHLAATLQTSGATDLVTFASPGNSPTGLPADLRHLALEFNDIPAPRKGYLEPRREHIDALLEFVRAWDGHRPLVLNCWMGISRSTAAAALTLAALEHQPDCATIARRLRLASPSATPNPLMIALGDEALQLDGALSQAITAIGRGAEACTGTPFELTVDIAKRAQNG
ncbi:MAG: tyrosine protein phosphatase [Pseudomonadota bacterium]